MKHLYLFILAIAINFFSAQNLSVEYFPPPNKLKLDYVKKVISKNIVYGATPPNYNGKVVVLVHGFLIDAWVFYREQTMLYDVAYKAGYKIVFTTTSSYSGDWANGQILSMALKRITSELKIPKVIIVAHSNGGKAVEVAMFHYGTRNLVDRVLALGVPFKGTQIADIVQTKPLKWILDIIPEGEGTKLSTTYYCENYFRPMMDNNPLNQPEKFYTLGTWGYASDNGYPIEALPLPLTGKLISLAGQEINDGIAPYYSTLRAGDAHLLESNDPRGNLNHMDIIRSVFAWDDFISPILEMDYIGNHKKELIQDKPYVVSSNYQLLSSADKDEYVFIDNKAKNIEVDIIYEKPNSTIELINPDNKILRKLYRNSVTTEKQTLSDQHIYSLKLNSPSRFKIRSKSNYLAFIKDDLNQPMVYRVNKLDNKTMLEVSFPNMGKSEVSSMSLLASMAYIGDLEGNGDEEKEEKLLFKQDNDGKFIVDVTNNKKGIYSVTLHAVNSNNYKRSLITGFVLSKDGDIEYNSNTAEIVNKGYQLLGNPIDYSSKLRIPENIRGKLTIKVYDIRGVLIKQNIMEATDLIPIGHHLYNLVKGNYILEVESDRVLYRVNFIK